MGLCAGLLPTTRSHRFRAADDAAFQAGLAGMAQVAVRRSPRDTVVMARATKFAIDDSKESEIETNNNDILELENGNNYQQSFTNFIWPSK